MTIDITPKTILRMATGFEFDGDKTTATTLRALSAALTKAEHLLKMQEIATEMAIVAWDQTFNDLTASQAETAAAYDAALDAASEYTQRVYGDDWTFLSNPIDRERILAAIPKGTPHE